MNILEEIERLDQKKNEWDRKFDRVEKESYKIYDSKTEDAGNIPENMERNRFIDVNPYDDTRVKLKTSSHDYINANFVEVPDINQKFIIAQGPLDNTCEDFWRMIWENRTQSIIMLNKTFELGQISCHLYWPKHEGDKHQYGEFIITNIKTSKEKCYIIHELTIVQTTTLESRTLKHYQFTKWPDFGVPKDPSLLLDFLQIITSHEVFNHQNTKPVIHCSAGIGRSGTFALIHTALAQVEREDNIDNLNIDKLLLSLRHWRCSLIQTEEQYRFAYISIMHGVYKLLPKLFENETSLPV